MRKSVRIMVAALGCAATAFAATATAQDIQWGARPTFAPDGTVHVPAFELPPSVFSSAEAQAMQAQRARMTATMPSGMPTVEETRARLDTVMAPQIEAMRGRYPVKVQESEVGGVPVRVFTPEDGKFDRKRVLINLHGGAFSVCWNACSMLESIPVASVGRYKVVSVNYRMAPEHKHPSGVEDVARVYGELLKTHKARNIGIYGCSAGGALTAQAGAWLPAHGMPQPGALGIFGAGGVRFMAGDSAYLAGYSDGSFPPPPRPGGKPGADMARGYFDGADGNGPVISPALHPDVIAKFPPTLFITGTRAMDMSPAIVTNSALIKAGVETDLIVGEGMGHCYLYMSNLPEARDAYGAIAAFFREHLK